MIKNTLLASMILGLTFATSNSVLAGQSNNECPVDLVNDMTLDEEFGEGTSDLTRCLERRHKVKVVMQVNRYCRDNLTNADCLESRAYALGNIRNMIKDYEITHDMEQGKDYEIAAIVHSGGGAQLLKGNKFESQVTELIDKGVRFYFCQNTTRGFINKGILPEGDATSHLIDGVEYVTAGVTALADFQSRGWTYVQP